MKIEFTTKVKGITNLTWLHAKDSIEDGYLYIEWEIRFWPKDYGLKSTDIHIKRISGNVDLIDSDTLGIRNVDLDINCESEEYDISLDIEGNWDHLYPTEIIIDYHKKDIEICFAR